MLYMTSGHLNSELPCTAGTLSNEPSPHSSLVVLPMKLPPNPTVTTNLGCHFNWITKSLDDFRSLGLSVRMFSERKG